MSEIPIQVENEIQFIQDNKFYELKNDFTFEEIKQKIQKYLLPFQLGIGTINEINRFCLISSWLKSKYEEYVEECNKIYKKAIERLELLQNEIKLIDFLENCMPMLQTLQGLLKISFSSSSPLFTNAMYFLSVILVKDKNSIFSKYLQSRIYTKNEQYEYFWKTEFNIFDNILRELTNSYILYRDLKSFFNQIYDKIKDYEEIIANSQLMSLLKSPNNKLMNGQFLYYENAIYFIKKGTYDYNKNKCWLDFLCRYDLVKNTLNKYEFMWVNNWNNQLAFFNKSIIAFLENKRKIVKFDLLINSCSTITYSDSELQGWKILVSYKINGGIHGIVALRCTPDRVGGPKNFMESSL